MGLGWFLFLLITSLITTKPINSLQDVAATCGSEPIVQESLLQAYQRDGFIVMRNLLPDDLLDALCQAGEYVAMEGQKFPNYFSVVERGLLFDGGLSLDPEEKDLAKVASAKAAFRETVLYSKLPQVAAELMGLNSSYQNLRVLRCVRLQSRFCEKLVYELSNGVRSCSCPITGIFSSQRVSMMLAVTGTLMTKGFGQNRFCHPRRKNREETRMVSMFGLRWRGCPHNTWDRWR